MCMDRLVMKGLPRRGRAVSGPPVVSHPDPVLTVRPSDVDMKDETKGGILTGFFDSLYF